MIQFKADSLQVSGPRKDGSYVVKFETGEYEVENVAKLLAMSNLNQIIKITVE